MKEGEVMQETVLKGGITGVGVIIAYLIGNFTPLFWLLVVFEVMDYITGMYAAYRGEGLSSKEAISGAIKKIFYFFLVAVAFGFDYMIYEAAHILPIDFAYPAIFGVLSIAYLLSTEMISVVENLEEIGISVPFVSQALKLFRDKVKMAGGEHGSTTEK